MKNSHAPYGFYEAFFKSFFDVICTFIFVLFFWWLYLVLALLIRINLGTPVLFKQKRPGKINPKTGKEEIFTLYKFRSMTDERDKNGNLCPDEVRLTAFGKKLRDTNMDELPEIFFNILIFRNMSWCGPRPQLVEDMCFMSERERMRHMVKPGLTGLAQINGRNAITWKEKFAWDLKYIDKITLTTDLKIIYITVRKMFHLDKNVDLKKEIDIMPNLGEELLQLKVITHEEYKRKKKMAIEMEKDEVQRSRFVLQKN